MARKKTGKNPRIKLQLPLSLITRLQSELEFQGIGDRILRVEDRQIESRNDFLRWVVVHPYVQRNFDYPPPPRDFDEETGFLDFWLDKHSKGLWDSAIRAGLATSHNNLVAIALADYFESCDRRAATLRATLPEYRDKIRSFDVAEWREILNR